jgi:hypothetical protein
LGPILCHKNHGKCNANATKLSHVFKKTDPILLVPVAILPVLATVGGSPWISSYWRRLARTPGKSQWFGPWNSAACKSDLFKRFVGGFPNENQQPSLLVQQIDPPISLRKRPVYEGDDLGRHTSNDILGPGVSRK